MEEAKEVEELNEQNSANTMWIHEKTFTAVTQTVWCSAIIVSCPEIYNCDKLL